MTPPQSWDYHVSGSLSTSAAHCSALQHTAAHCSTLQHTARTATHYTKSVSRSLLPSLWPIAVSFDIFSCEHLQRGGQRNCVCCRVLQCVAYNSACCSILQSAAVRCRGLQWLAVCRGVLQCAAMCCGMLQCAAVCCSVLQWVAVCCSVL